jgi:hypothetical protein
LRSIASLQRTVSTPQLVDFSRASLLDLFEQPATRVFNKLLDLKLFKTEKRYAVWTPSTGFNRRGDI